MEILTTITCLGVYGGHATFHTYVYTYMFIHTYMAVFINGQCRPENTIILIVETPSKQALVLGIPSTYMWILAEKGPCGIPSRIPS